MSATVGVIVNPGSGRDVRRVAARAADSTPQSKRNQVARIAIGAVASGARRLIVARDPFRISEEAVRHLRLDAEIEVIDIGARVRPEDSARAADAMRASGCGALVVLGGDGTQRTVAKAWPGVPMVPVSTGTNNVFPFMLEATLAGSAAALVVLDEMALEQVAPRAKCIRVEIDGGPRDLALVDAVLLVGDFRGNLLPFEPAHLRRILLARAEPAAIGTSPIGGLLHPAGIDDDFGVEVECGGAVEGSCELRVPISPGLYRPVRVASWRRVELEQAVEFRGPGVLAFDGDREYTLAPGQSVRLRIERAGPRVIRTGRVFSEAARLGRFLDRPAWRDPHAGG